MCRICKVPSKNLKMILKIFLKSLHFLGMMVHTCNTGGKGSGSKFKANLGKCCPKRGERGEKKGKKWGGKGREAKPE